LERPDERLVDVVGNEADEARITPLKWREVQKISKDEAKRLEKSYKRNFDLGA